MKFIFFGTPEFAATVLEKLIEAGCMPKAVICNPDEPTGRKQVITPPPVKQLVIDNTYHIDIFQPVSQSDLLVLGSKLTAIKPDMAVIAAYGKIIPKEILEIPVLGFLNVHPSLLPKYRGASPIQYAILNGEKETGVTIMKIDEEMDHGPILSVGKFPIDENDTYKTLSDKLSEFGAELLIKIIPDYVSGKTTLVEQDHSKATYTKIIKKEDGKINWSHSADEILRMTYAYYPWPTAWTTWNSKTFHPAGDHPKDEKILKIIEAEVSENNDRYKIGEVFLTDLELAVKSGKDVLVIKKLQLEGGNILTAKEFLNGHNNFIGSTLE